MIRRKIQAGTTSLMERVFIRDTATTSSITGKTGLAYNTSSLTAYYIREGDSSATSISLVTATVGTYTSGGFKEIDSTHMPGQYELHIPNAALASGAKSCTIQLRGATGMEETIVEYELDAVNYQDSLRLGLTALPATASGTLGGVLTSGTGTGQLSVSGGFGNANATKWAGDVILAGSLPVTIKAGQPGGVPTLRTIRSGAITTGNSAGQSTVITDFTAGQVARGMIALFNDSVGAAKSYVVLNFDSGVITFDKPLETGVADDEPITLCEIGILGAAIAGDDMNAAKIGGQTVSATGTITFPSGTLPSTTTVMPDTAGTGTLLGRITAARAGYLDALNISGAVASHADVAAINQSAAKHLLIQTVGQYERPESGSATYTVECRTFSAATGAAVNADTTPTLAAIGIASGDLSANIGSATNPATGVYRWAYTVASAATIEQIRFDVSATISSTAYTLACYTQVCDFVATTFTTADRTLLQEAHDQAALIGTNDADSPNTQTMQETVGTNLDAKVSDASTFDPATDKVDLVDAPNTTALSAIVSAIIGSTLFAGVTSLAKWLRAGFRSDTPDATALSEINATGGSYSATTDSQQAIRDRGDSAWVTGSEGSGGSGDASEATSQKILKVVQSRSGK